MANRNQYTSTPGYLGGQRVTQPRQPQRRAEAPERRPGVARKQPDAYAARPMGDTVILTLLFIIAPLCGLLGVLIKAFLWIFVGVTLIALVAMWAMNCFEVRGRAFISGVLAVLSVVAMISLVDAAPKNTGYPTYGEGDNLAQSAGSGPLNPAGAGLTPTATAPIQVASVGEATPTPPPAATAGGVISPAQDVLEKFLQSWRDQDFEGMVQYTTPSWRKAQTDPKRQLYYDFTNLALNSWTISSDMSSPAGDSATLKVIADLTKRSGLKESLQNEYSAIVFLVDGMWYVDPATMRTGIAVTAATPNPNSGDAQMSVVSPTPEPTVNPKTKLWYNPDGGTFYHTDAKCPDINPKYHKLMQSFTYAQLSEKKYSKLNACPTCKAPK